MSKKLVFALVMIGVVIASTGISGETYKQTIVVKSNGVSTYMPSDAGLGKYYVIQFQVPDLPPGEKLETAVLEFYVDAGSISREINLFPGTDSAQTPTYVNRTPVIEVFALQSAMGAELDPSQLDPDSRRIQLVVVGSRRHVRMDVTSIVRRLVAEPARNLGLVIGSVSGMREGDFTLLSGVLPDGAVVRVRLYSAPGR